MPTLADFEKPFYGLKRQGTKAQPKTVTLIVISWVPKGKNEPALTNDQLRQLFFGSTDSVANWFYEASQGRYHLVPHPVHPVLGPFESKYWWPFYWRNARDALKKDLTPQEWADFPYKVPPPKDSPHYYKAPDGTEYYLDDEGYIGGHTHSWAEAIRRASEIIDFQALDRDHDGYLSSDDALIVIVKAQKGTFGTRNEVTGSDVPKTDLVVDSVKIKVICELYVGQPVQPDDFAVAVEEVLHLAANLDDQYPDDNFRHGNDPGRPGQFSLSDAGHRPVHVDPYHRLKWGWLNATVVDKSGVYTLRDAATTGEALILTSPIKGHENEFFIVENRWRGNSYDRYRIPDRGDGLAIWHCIEDPSLQASWARRAVHLRRAEPRLDAQGHIQWTKALFDGADPARSYVLNDDSTPQNLRLRNNERSGLQISNISPAGPQMTLRVTLPESHALQETTVELIAEALFGRMV